MVGWGGGGGVERGMEEGGVGRGRRKEGEVGVLRGGKVGRGRGGKEVGGGGGGGQ